jgi:lincosamide nucleotidyltransferase A/C/D/E
MPSYFGCLPRHGSSNGFISKLTFTDRTIPRSCSHYGAQVTLPDAGPLRGCRLSKAPRQAGKLRFVRQRWGRDRHPRADMEAQRVIDLLERLDEFAVAVWLDGGWGVEALLGTQKRSHDDLDLIVGLDDVPRLLMALGGMGYVPVHGAPPLSFEMTDSEGHQVDVHPVCFKAGGEAVYKLQGGGDWVYPPGALSGIGTILGRDVRCQSAEMQLLAHTTGYALDAAHRDEVVALSERFGLPLPPFRSS